MEKSVTPAAQANDGAPVRTLAAALEREHRHIDQGIDAFLAARAEGRIETEPLTEAVTALRRHIFLEEEFLFPPLRHAGLVAPIFVMLREHGEIWDTIDMLEAQLSTGVVGAAAAETCQELLAQLARHNAKEEPILYTRADDVLSRPATATLTAFLAAGRMPEGWTCARSGAG